ncbi:MAG: tyrosine-protein phosphatase [Synergistaceae bacterium]|jgi:protein tyrosine/serine phosphatase|nr:tyrosine-protein phosphatase [Synergistaceae bacterium]
MRRRLVIFLFSIVIFCESPCSAMDRSPEWAAPVWLDGVPNCHRVTENIYRSAQPDEQGFRNLESLGIRTVINLRETRGDRLSGTSLRGIRVKMRAWDPETDDVIRVIRILSDDGGGPYLVHCRQGADRTGLVIAAYRMAVQGWSREDAIDEMMNGGYGFNEIWVNIPLFLRRIDIERVRAALR